MTPKNILLLGGNSSQCLPLIKSFAQKGHKTIVVSPYWGVEATFSRYTTKNIYWSFLDNNSKYFLNQLLCIIQREQVDLILALGDGSSKLLSKNKTVLEAHVKLIVPDYEIFSIAADKLRTMEFCMKNDIPCPITFTSNFPRSEKILSKDINGVIIKPRIGVGSTGVYKVNTFEEAIGKAAQLQKDFGEFLIQEYIEGNEHYTVEAFCDNIGDLKACVILKKNRYYPIQGGTSSCTTTVFNKEIFDVTKILLKKLNWRGSANIDIIMDSNGIPRVIEINPRVGAVIKSAFISGVDMGQLILGLAFKDTDIPERLKFSEGLILRNVVLEILWLISTKRYDIKNSNPYFFKIDKQTFFQNFDKDDPFPILGNVMNLFRKFVLKPREIRKKLRLA